MAIIQVQAPDGSIIKLDAPEGATPEMIKQKAQMAFNANTARDITSRFPAATPTAFSSGLLGSGGAGGFRGAEERREKEKRGFQEERENLIFQKLQGGATASSIEEGLSTPAGERSLISIGRGFTDIGRGLNLFEDVDKEQIQEEERLLSGLEVADPVGSQISRGIGQAAGPIAAGLALPATGAAGVLGATALAAAEGAAVSRGTGGDLGQQLKSGGLTGGITLAASLIFPNAGKLLKRLATKNADDLGADKEVANLLASAMQREGLTPQQAAARLQELGPDAIPADISAEFLNLLEQAKNQSGRIAGRTSKELSERGQQGGQRIIDDVEDALGLSTTVDDALSSLRQKIKPRTDELYAAARAKDFEPDGDLFRLFEESPTIKTLKRKANIPLQDRVAQGEKVGNIDLIDEMKRQLDDDIGKAIRTGEGNKVFRLSQLKGNLLKQVDKAVPEYAQARSLYAGAKELENAATAGENFIKLKPREVDALVNSMGASEKEMFKIGARQAIVDKIESTASNRNIRQSIFGKNADTQKLKSLFDGDKEFKDFQKALERESAFVRTKSITQQSSTARQLAQQKEIELGRGLVDAAVSPIAAIPILRNFITKAGQKRSKEKANVLANEIGDFLLEKGVDPSRLQRILEKGRNSLPEIQREAKKQLKKEMKRRRALVASRTSGVVAPLGSEESDQ